VSEVTASSVSPLGKIAELLDALDHAAIAYCHWKSNEAIEASLAGENDLDLLVAREDAVKFRGVLASLGFTQVRPTERQEIPGIEDFLGRDAVTGRVVHVQPHYELILGDDMTKAYRLPIERDYLSSVQGDRAGIPLPEPEFEHLVFVIRMVLKHCPAEALIARKGRLTASERRELADLESRIDADQARALRNRLLPFLDDRIFELGRSAIERETGFFLRARAGRRLVRSLTGQARHPAAIDSILKVRARVRRRVAQLVGAPRGKRPASGGLVVAVVGGDGSGKSSLVEGLTRDLAGVFDLTQAHLGKPPRSLLTRAITRPLRILRNRGAFQETRLPAWHEHTSFPGYVFMIWHVLIARDRFLLYARLRRRAESGAVIVTDRFPLDRITTMDARRLSALPGLEHRRLAAWLGAREDLYYRRIRPPDLVFVLRVHPDLAVSRRADQDETFVRQRAQEVWDVDWKGSGFHVLDASRTREEVQAEALSCVWRHL
jgi:thymidylate kinase